METAQQFLVFGKEINTKPCSTVSLKQRLGMAGVIPQEEGMGVGREVCSTVTSPVPLAWPHLYSSSQLSGSALSWPRALTSLSPNLPASSRHRAETPDAQGSLRRASRQSSQEHEVLPCHLHCSQAGHRGR